jgi:hypothetical protein
MTGRDALDGQRAFFKSQMGGSGAKLASHNPSIAIDSRIGM